MGANGNRKQTLRTNIVQPYETGFLTNTDHKDYNAVVGTELDKVSTATKHMFQGLDDVRREVVDRTKALDALHLQVNDQFNRVSMEIADVKLQLGQGITMDNIVDADGNSLSGVLQGLKTEVNTANGQVMVAIGEITNLNTRFDGEILKVNTSLDALGKHVDTEVQRITGVITTTKDGLTQQIAKVENDIKTTNTSLTQTQSTITTINRDGTQSFKNMWAVQSAINGITSSFGLYQTSKDPTKASFVVNAASFMVRSAAGKDGSSVFEVDAKTGVTRIKQAMIGHVTIDAAQVKNLTIDAGKVTGNFQSIDWPNSGWQLTRGTGSGVNGGKLTIKGVAKTARTELTNKALIVYDSADTPRVIVGSW